ncbi:multicopper oxidase family protein [Neisseria sp. Dent CA1/247]|uniref:multicopper oxidase family protein n=1 Tax=Neisseria sp. Dent CA1/247 TaxID=2912675 RepID=UPI001FCFC827|nr:multicopper oxidase family protein [Neisseria sp. Dent CA1/247]UOO76899.1 multicopper oxidase family protein [Neisseria sp. Dent CA1/247]
MKSINRRQFLTFGLSTATGVVLLRSGCAWAGRNGMTEEHHGLMREMRDSMMKEQAQLLSLDALPQGKPLKPLSLLGRRSGKYFQAEITAREQQIELIKDKPTTFFTYNGHLPGQLIEVMEGDTVNIEFVNLLKEETTVHWHGLPVPPEQDGNPNDPVRPGEIRRYTFTLPEGSAGTYWYHTHAHNLVSRQAYKGLAGAIIVHSEGDPLRELPEQHWLFSDLRLDSDGKLPENTMMDWMNGREGQFTLINGQFRPTIEINGTQRIRIWNTCNARYLNLSIPKAELIVVGTDGGLLEKAAKPVSSLLIAPAERYEVVIKGGDGTFELQDLPYDRKKMMQPFKAETRKLGTVLLKNTKDPQLPIRLRLIAELSKPTAFKQVIFSEQMGRGMNNMFLVNGKSYDMNRIDLTSRINEIEEWTIINDSHMDHPFHLHGSQFIVTERSWGGKTEKVAKALKDTVNLRPYESIKFRVMQVDKGIRMFHCHILEHENLGMMGQLAVE